MPRSSTRSGLRFAGIGLEFAAGVAGLTLFGYWLDRKFGLSPWGVLIGAALGLVGGTYNMIRETLPFVRSQGAENSEGAKPPDVDKVNQP